MSREDAPRYRDSQGGPRCNECRHEEPSGHCRLFGFVFDTGYTCDAYAAPRDHVRLRQVLLRQVAQLKALKDQVGQARQTLKQRAVDQLDSMPGHIQAVGDHVARGKGGGILAQRQLRTLLTERRRLSGIAATHKARDDG